MKSLKQLGVTMTGHPVQEGCQDYHFVSFLSYGILNAFVTSSERTVCLEKSVVHLFVNPVIRVYHATQVGILMDSLQLCLADEDGMMMIAIS